MNQLTPRLVRQLFVILSILALGSLIFVQILPYLSGFLGAITIFVISRGLMERLIKKINKHIAAGILMLGSFILIILPIFGIVYMLSSKISKAVSSSERLVNAVKSQIQIFQERFNYDISTNIDTSALTSWVSENLQSFAGSTFNVLISLTIMYFILYYLLINQKDIKKALELYVPIEVSNIHIIGREVGEKVRANAIGIPLVAIVQGVISLIGYLIFGVPDPFFWFVITTVGSMIPFIGTALGFIPATIILFSQGMNLEAIGLITYGVVIVGSSDNIIRLFILKSMANEHPLITLLGVIIGVPLFGFIGLIFGPLLISLFLIIIYIYKKEYGDQSPNKKESS